MLFDFEWNKVWNIIKPNCTGVSICYWYDKMVKCFSMTRLVSTYNSLRLAQNPNCPPQAQTHMLDPLHPHPQLTLYVSTTESSVGGRHCSISSMRMSFSSTFLAVKSLGYGNWASDIFTAGGSVVDGGSTVPDDSMTPVTPTSGWARFGEAASPTQHSAAIPGSPPLPCWESLPV